jgi:Cu-Zn family superoxide dismutase
MRTLLMATSAAVLLTACTGMSVGVGVGGGSGNVGAGASASIDVGGDDGRRTAGSQITVSMFKISDKGIGAEIGTLMFADTDRGLRMEPALGGLPPGDHGFHIHEKPDCGPAEKDGKMQAGLAAGNHYDPTASGKHLGPSGPGHHGDLPVLKVDAEGNATELMFVERLHIKDLRGRSVMIHEGGDNYADQPKPFGGGGARIACGVVTLR